MLRRGGGDASSSDEGTGCSFDTRESVKGNWIVNLIAKTNTMDTIEEEKNSSGIVSLSIILQL